MNTFEVLVDVETVVGYESNVSLVVDFAHIRLGGGGNLSLEDTTLFIYSSPS